MTLALQSSRLALLGSAALLLVGIAPAVAQPADLGPIPAVDLPAPSDGPRAVAGEFIVKLREGVSTRDALPSADLSTLGLGGAARVTSGGELIYRLTPGALFDLQSAAAADARAADIVASLNARPNVEYAQQNFLVEPFDTTPNDPGYPFEWHLHNNGSGAGQSPGGINLPIAWDTIKGDSSVVVSVVDTGIVANHADIAGSGNLIAGYDMITDPFISNDGDGRDNDATDAGDAVVAGECGTGSPARDDSWHGSHVAGTVGVVGTNNGGGIAGVNWEVSIQPVRVLGKCGGTTVDINDAIRWAAGLPVPGVPDNTTPAKVINMSLGAPVPCTASPSTQAAINDAFNAGVTVVVAAGNSAMDASNAFPASCDNVISVAASDFRGHLVERYSNFGDVVDILAPGGDVDRDDNGDSQPDGVLSVVDGGFAFYNGTSMAAPHVAGVAGLMLAVDDSLTPSEIEAEIKANAMTRDATQCPHPCGAGLLDASFLKDVAKADYEYVAKMVCGVQEDPKRMALVRGFYGTTINIRNPGRTPVRFRKSLALTLPPGFQEPGQVIPIAKDELPPRHALAADCDDLRERFGGLPQPFIEGFLVLESTGPLNVVGVYTTAGLNEEGLAGEHSSIHVEPIPASGPPKKPDDDQRKPDLTVESIGEQAFDVDCPNGAGSCVTTVDVLVTNIGAADAGAFMTRVVLDPAAGVVVNHSTPTGLAVGDSTNFKIVTPPGGNCFDPDCTICAMTDQPNNVMESNEGNNQLCITSPG